MVTVGNEGHMWSGRESERYIMLDDSGLEMLYFFIPVLFSFLPPVFV